MCSISISLYNSFPRSLMKSFGCHLINRFLITPLLTFALITMLIAQEHIEKLENIFWQVELLFSFACLLASLSAWAWGRGRTSQPQLEDPNPNRLGEGREQQHDHWDLEVKIAGWAKGSSKLQDWSSSSYLKPPRLNWIHSALRARTWSLRLGSHIAMEDCRMINGIKLLIWRSSSYPKPPRVNVVELVQAGLLMLALSSFSHTA